MGYDHGHSYNIGEFAYYAILEREEEKSKDERDALDRLRSNVIYSLTENAEYDVRLYILRAEGLARKDNDSESDPYLVV